MTTEELLARYRAGETLIALAPEAGISPQGLRGRFIRLVGGREAWDALYAERAPTAPARTPASTPVDDSAVLHVTGTPVKEGWRAEHRTVAGLYVVVLTAPDGEEYLKALRNEQADLIVLPPDRPYANGMGPSRWRLLDTARRVQRAKAAEKKEQRATKKRRAAKKQKEWPSEELFRRMHPEAAGLTDKKKTVARKGPTLKRRAKTRK